MGIKTYQEKNANAMEKELAQSDIPVHNVHIVQQDAPVSEMALYMIQGDDRIPMYFDQNWGIKRQNPVVDTGV